MIRAMDRLLRWFLVIMMLVPSVANAGSTVLWLDALMNRRSINAVHLDGNTWLEISAPWNAPALGTTFFRSWWERSDAQIGDTVAFAVGNGAGDLLEILEIPSVDQGSDQLYVLTTVLDGNNTYSPINCLTPGNKGIIPRNGKWTLIQVAIDTTMMTCQYFVQQGTSFLQTAHMTYLGIAGSIPWGDATTWREGGSVNGYAHPVMDIAERYLDLRFSWILTDGVAPLIFATESGFARNLDWRQGFPHDLPDLHDCGEPLAGLLPEMCGRGDINYALNGHEVSPSHFAYVMTEHGNLQPTASDPCLIRGIGDGCSGP